LKTPGNYSRRFPPIQSLTVCGFCGCEAKGPQPPLLFCVTPLALDELFVDWHPALNNNAAQHSSSVPPQRSQFANRVTAKLPIYEENKEKENVAAEFPKKPAPRPEGK
jgi:hypothetical protein